MTLFLLDTDQLTLYQMGHPQVVQNVVKHASHALAVSVITVEEQLTGWQRALHIAKTDARREHIYQRLADTVHGLTGWQILPFPLAAIHQHAVLIRARLNVGSFDLKIAAIALEYGAIVVTRNVRDFGRVPGLSIADWTK
jgi:tRNA(fMet)-specific endonuclease VapC